MVKKSPIDVDQEKTKRKKKTTNNKKGSTLFSAYIYKVLKQVHPEMGISKNGMSVMNSFVNDLFERVASEAHRLTQIKGQTTMLTLDVQTAARLILPGELAKHAISEGTKAMNQYNKSKSK